jgi:hypothetical protein
MVIKESGLKRAQNTDKSQASCEKKTKPHKMREIS